MKILYISHLVNSVSSGLTWSVPASVNAQSKIDEVYWLNTTPEIMEHWKNVKSFHQCLLPKLSLSENLTTNFKDPDIVVFEGFYDSLIDVIWGRELKIRNIPYIIIPRGALTINAMNNHAKLKKKMAHYFFYDRFIKESTALQFLTKEEAEETLILFKTPYFIIPNGFNIPSLIKEEFSKGSIKCIFIGRIDIYQKGLDILMYAIANLKKKLTENRFMLKVYGPINKDYDELISIIGKLNIANIVQMCGEISGKEKEKVLLDSDVFFLTSRFEGHPMGLIEALSYGVPAFVTPGTNMADEIEKSDSGWICKDFTVDEIETQLKNMIFEQTFIQKKGYNALMLSKSYNWNLLAERFHNEISKICSNNGVANLAGTQS